MKYHEIHKKKKQNPNIYNYIFESLHNSIVLLLQMKTKINIKKKQINI